MRLSVGLTSSSVHVECMPYCELFIIKTSQIMECKLFCENFVGYFVKTVFVISYILNEIDTQNEAFAIYFPSGLPVGRRLIQMHQIWSLFYVNVNQIFCWVVAISNPY